jgi:hypothetical protein
MDILLAMVVLDIIGTAFRFLRKGLPKIKNPYILYNKIAYFLINLMLIYAF